MIDLSRRGRRIERVDWSISGCYVRPPWSHGIIQIDIDDHVTRDDDKLFIAPVIVTLSDVFRNVRKSEARWPRRQSRACDGPIKPRSASAVRLKFRRRRGIIRVSLWRKRILRAKLVSSVCIPRDPLRVRAREGIIMPRRGSFARRSGNPWDFDPASSEN